MSPVCLAFEEACGFMHEIVTLVDCLFNFHDISGGWGRDGERFRGVDHEYCELELDVWVLCFLCICTI